MVDQQNNPPAQLPEVPERHTAGSIAPNVPSAQLSPAEISPQAEVVQQALAVLTDTGLPLYQRAERFALIKEGYIAKTHGITIE